MKSLIESVKPTLINPVNPVYVLPGFLRACFVGKSFLSKRKIHENSDLADFTLFCVAG